jgi:hypothetical protein
LGNRSELSNHSFSSRCRAYWRTAALEPTRQRQALVKERVRCAPAGIAIAAGSHNITNFDAQLARDAARVQFEVTMKTFHHRGHRGARRHVPISFSGVFFMICGAV